MDLAGLLEEHGDHLLRLCTLYLGDRSQAEDAVQDTFLRALRLGRGFEETVPWRRGWCVSLSMCVSASSGAVEASAGAAGEPGQPAHGRTGTAGRHPGTGHTGPPAKIPGSDHPYYYQEWKPGRSPRGCTFRSPP